jgi:hypothetical protein
MKQNHLPSEVPVAIAVTVAIAVIADPEGRMEMTAIMGHADTKGEEGLQDQLGLQEQQELLDRKGLQEQQELLVQAPQDQWELLAHLERFQSQQPSHIPQELLVLKH